MALHTTASVPQVVDHDNLTRRALAESIREGHQNANLEGLADDSSQNDKLQNIPFNMESQLSRVSRHPDMATQEARLKSFAAWAHTDVCAPDGLADAGFYYAGEANNIRCFDCGIQVKITSKSDADPRKEHALWNDDCPFLLQHQAGSGVFSGTTSGALKTRDPKQTVKRQHGAQKTTQSEQPVSKQGVMEASISTENHTVSTPPAPAKHTVLEQDQGGKNGAALIESRKCTVDALVMKPVATDQHAMSIAVPRPIADNQHAEVTAFSASTEKLQITGKAVVTAVKSDSQFTPGDALVSASSALGKIAGAVSSLVANVQHFEESTEETPVADVHNATEVVPVLMACEEEEESSFMSLQRDQAAKNTSQYVLSEEGLLRRELPPIEESEESGIHYLSSVGQASKMQGLGKDGKGQETTKSQALEFDSERLMPAAQQADPLPPRDCHVRQHPETITSRVQESHIQQQETSTTQSVDHCTQQNVPWKTCSGQDLCHDTQQEEPSTGQANCSEHWQKNSMSQASGTDWCHRDSSSKHEETFTTENPDHNVYRQSDETSPPLVLGSDTSLEQAHATYHDKRLKPSTAQGLESRQQEKGPSSQHTLNPSRHSQEAARAQPFGSMQCDTTFSQNYNAPSHPQALGCAAHSCEYQQKRNNDAVSENWREDNHSACQAEDGGGAASGGADYDNASGSDAGDGETESSSDDDETEGPRGIYSDVEIDLRERTLLCLHCRCEEKQVQLPCSHRNLCYMCFFCPNFWRQHLRDGPPRCLLCGERFTDIRDFQVLCLALAFNHRRPRTPNCCCAFRRG